MTLFFIPQAQTKTAGHLVLKQPVQIQSLQLCLLPLDLRVCDQLGTQPMLHNFRRARFAPGIEPMISIRCKQKTFANF
jgi:hypothetical protein